MKHLLLAALTAASLYGGDVDMCNYTFRQALDNWNQYEEYVKIEDERSANAAFDQTRWWAVKAKVYCSNLDSVMDKENRDIVAGKMRYIAAWLGN